MEDTPIGTSPDDEGINRLASLIQQAISLTSAGQPGEALLVLPQLLAADDAVFVAAHLDLTKAFINAVAGLRATGQPDLLEQLFLKGLGAIRRHPSARLADQFICLNILAGLYAQHGDYDASSRAVSALVHLADQITEPVDDSSVQLLMGIGEMCQQSEQHGATVILYRLVNRSLEAISLSPDTRVHWLQRYGRALILNGQHAEAIAAYRSGLAALGENGDAVPERAGLYVAVADAAQSGGDSQAAEDAFQAACALFERSGQQDSPMAGVVYHNFATWYVREHRVDRYDDAERLVRQAVAIARRTSAGPTADQAASVALVAQVVSLRGDVDEADRLYKESIGTFDAAPDTNPVDLAAYLNDWGMLLLTRGRPGDAVVPLDRALKILESLPGAPVTADALSNLATAHFEAGSLQEAVPLYRRVLDLRHQSIA